MACGVPVVTTTLGLGDISATKNEAILIAETPYQFSKHIINLIENNLINNKIGAAGYRYVKEYHDLEMLNHKFLYTIEKSCQKYS
jgi:glycosyltransferase involved in cell wall biosynthesis